MTTEPPLTCSICGSEYIAEVSQTNSICLLCLTKPQAAIFIEKEALNPPSQSNDKISTNAPTLPNDSSNSHDNEDCIANENSISNEDNLSNNAQSIVFCKAEKTLLDNASLGVEVHNEDDSEEVSPDEGDSKYRFVKEIGRGGMGKVLLYKDNYLRRHVARKLILGSQKKETYQRFIEEAQITGQLEHPNIIPIHEMGIDDSGHTYFAMKYIKGQSLQEIITALKNGKKEEWSLHRMLRIFLEICYAVDYAHSKNVIHRDLKPDNIMIGHFGEVLVMDWGLAKAIGQGQEVFTEDSISTVRENGTMKTITGKVMGTPHYMSPEQAEGLIDELSFPSDVYSLGAILYEMAVGHRCVSGRLALVIIGKVARGKIEKVPAKGVFGPISKELVSIIHKALALNPQDRYPSALELAKDVARWLEGEKVQAFDYKVTDKTRRFFFIYRKEALLATAMFVSICLALVSWSQYLHIQQASFHEKKASQALDSVEHQEKLKNFYHQSAEHHKKVEDSTKKRKRQEEIESHFASISEIVTKSATTYREAYHHTPEYRLKLLEAKAWQMLFEAASLAKKDDWMKTTTFKIQGLLTDKDYQQVHHERSKGHTPIYLSSKQNNVTYALYRHRYNSAGHVWEAHPFHFKEHRFSDPDDKEGTINTLPAEIDLPPGSYRFVFFREAHAPVTHLLYLTHAVNTEFWEGIFGDEKMPSLPGPPNSISLKIDLKAEENIPARILQNFVHIPATWFLAGGESEGWSHHWRESQPFYIEKDEVSIREYHKFIQQIVVSIRKKGLGKMVQVFVQEQKKRDSENLAHFIKLLLDREKTRFLEEHRSKLGSEENEELPSVYITNKEIGEFIQPFLPRKMLRWDGKKVTWAKEATKEADIPVIGVSKFACDFYALWNSFLDKRFYRLPEEWEWELAARGADGRTFSSGNISSKEEHSSISPWGVKHLTGSVAEWTKTPFAGQKNTFVVKGKQESLPLISLKCDFRIAKKENHQDSGLGFRMVFEEKKGKP